jgi:hypothetical protein
VQALFSEKDEPVMGKLHHQNSPKLDNNDLGSRYASGSNRTMPLASSGNKIDKQAYLNKAEPIRTSGGNNEALLKKPMMQGGVYDNNPMPFSTKVLSDAQDNPFNKSSSQASPLRKAPRLS